MKKYSYPRLKELRELYDFSQEEVAIQLNISVKTYGAYERGERDLPTLILIKIASIYSVTTDYLLNNSDSYD